MTIVLSIPLAAFLGFAAHRCGVCGVKAVAEIMSTGHAFMLLSFAKIFLWVAAATFIVAGFGLTDSETLLGYSISTRALTGGLLFGIGATINGGCAFSTLTYLGSGDLRYLATIAGFGIGVGLYLLLFPSFPIPDLALHWSPLTGPTTWLLPIAVLTWIWASWELWRLLGKKTSRSGNWGERLFAGRYRLSAGAALIGVANAILFALHGSWAYTGAIAQTVEKWISDGSGSNWVTVILAIAVMAGIIISALQSGKFNLQISQPTRHVIHLTGGAIMGFSAALVPGGNFVLILHGIPMLSPHALPTFAALIAGVALSLLLMKALTGKLMRIDCSGDVCRG
jgi:uncharacterized membrane protein YedE/YeeE